MEEGKAEQKVPPLVILRLERLVVDRRQWVLCAVHVTLLEAFRSLVPVHLWQATLHLAICIGIKVLVVTLKR